MKDISLTRVVTKEESVKLGDKGELILIKVKGREGYRLGKLEGIDEKTIQGKSVPTIVFQGDTYNLNFTKVFEKEIIHFRKSPRRKEYASNRIDEIVSGNENVINYINTIHEGKYKAHADFLKDVK